MVKDKQQSRCLGPRSALTKQPVGGRANDGGLRIGEMERDSVIGHGAAGFLNESMMERSDKYYMAVCNKSGMLAIYNPSKNLFMSPMSDGPLTFLNEQLHDAEQLRLQTVTRFGRDFSIVEVPYTLKLLIQELQTANVQLRIITEDNVDQLEALSYHRIADPVAFKKQLEVLGDTSASKNQDLRGKVQDMWKLMTPAASVPGPAAVPGTGPVPEATTPSEAPPKTPSETPPGLFSPHTPSEAPPKSPSETPPELFSPHTPSEAPPESPHEDLYSPSTPSEAPPASSPSASLSSAPSFQVRQFVHLQGDVKPSRTWFIDSIEQTKNNKQVYVLMTNDYEGLDKQHQIQVVKESRLIPIPSSYQESAGSEAMTRGAMTGGGKIPFVGSGSGGAAANAFPGEGENRFIFAPVLVNGNNNGLGESMYGGGGGFGGNEPNPMAAYPPHSHPHQHPPPLRKNVLDIQHIGGGHLGTIDSRPSSGSSQEKGNREGTNQEKQGSWFSKAVNFGKEMLIKKVG